MKRIFALTLLALLGGCGMFAEKAPAPCPRAGFMEDAGVAVFFADAAPSPTDADVGVRARMKSLRGACEMTRDNKAQLHLAFDLSAERTEAGKLVLQQNLSYFVAVVGPDDEILQRSNYYAAVDFGAANTVLRTIEHDVKFKVADPARAREYRVLTGFTLTPEQLAFNRDEKIEPPAPEKKPAAKVKRKPKKKKR